MKARGFTLIELMIAVAILAIVAAIAIPAYNGYITESRLGAMRMNLDTLRIAVEAFRLDDASGTYGAKATLNSTQIFDRYGWRAEGDSGAYVYTAYITSTGAYSLGATGSGYETCCRKTTTAFSCQADKDASVTCP
jgi:type IV pilus assembly protein PilE